MIRSKRFFLNTAWEYFAEGRRTPVLVKSSTFQFTPCAKYLIVHAASPTGLKGSDEQGRCNADPDARSITIQITDACPECQPDQLDIQALTFNKVTRIPAQRFCSTSES
jgi:hypothetical protein